VTGDHPAARRGLLDRQREERHGGSLGSDVRI
jgi:hypothetical protein